VGNWRCRHHQPQSSTMNMATVRGRRVPDRRKSGKRSRMRVRRSSWACTAAGGRNRGQRHGHAPVKPTGTRTVVGLSALVPCIYPSVPYVSRACRRWSGFRRIRFTYRCVSRGGEWRLPQGTCLYPTWGTAIRALLTPPVRRCRTDGWGATTAMVATRWRMAQVAIPPTSCIYLPGRDGPQLDVVSGLS